MTCLLAMTFLTVKIPSSMECKSYYMYEWLIRILQERKRSIFKFYIP